MNSQLLGRALGISGHQSFQQWQTTRLIDSLSLAPDIRFDGNTTAAPSSAASGSKRKDISPSPQVWAHRSGVNAITIDHFNGQYLLSGGADSTLHLWDLNSLRQLHHPIASAPRTATSHTHGITTATFYPFDLEAVITSSYDHTLKLYAVHPSAPLAEAASFALGSVVHAHAMSPVGQHVLIAAATQGGVVRLVDLRSGSMAQGLVGHRSAVLACAWSPRREHVLVSGGADGGVRVWDVRRSAAAIGVLGLEDEVGVVERGGTRSLEDRAHVGACNGVAWSPDGEFIISTGLDERIRVWEAATGKNTLVHFGASVRNRRMVGARPTMVNTGGRQLVFWPNEREILVGDIVEGKIIRRLRPLGQRVAQSGKGVGDIKERVAGVAWRGGGHVEIYSGHADGVIRAWLPYSAEVDDESEEEEEEDQEGQQAERRRKRKALDDIHRDLTRQKITFS